MKETFGTALDVSGLPTYGFGARNPLWWGNLAFMVIEGLGFAFGVATYLYLYNQNKSWPLGPQLPLLWSSVLLSVMFLSELPNVWLKRIASRQDLGRARIGLLVMSAIGLLTLVIRGLEMKAMPIRWDANAYGSVSWFLLGLHSLHLLTDIVETWVMTLCLFLGPVDLRRFPEVEDNQDYWHFVVFFSGVVYIVLYWLPRWFEVLP